MSDYSHVPLVASRHLEQAEGYDLVGYMEDDLLLSDPEFFAKILYLDRYQRWPLCLLPHRCEHIPGRGDVILSGDPDGGRPDLFWDTGETFNIPWPTRESPLLSSHKPPLRLLFPQPAQALGRDFWVQKNWRPDWNLVRPPGASRKRNAFACAQFMKPIPEHYRFLMVRHQDNLWKRHPLKHQSRLSTSS